MQRHLAKAVARNDKQIEWRDGTGWERGNELWMKGRKVWVNYWEWKGKTKGNSEESTDSKQTEVKIDRKRKRRKLNEYQ